MGDNLSNLASDDAFREWLNSDENRYDSTIYYDQFVLYLENNAIDKNLISDICTSIIDFGKWHNNSKSELFAQDLDQCGQIEEAMPTATFLSLSEAVPDNI